MKIDTAMVKDGVVTGLYRTEQAGLEALEDALKTYGDCDRLIPVDNRVRVGDTYDEEKSIFLRDGVRVFPDKTDSERIADLEAQLEDTQAALLELAEIVGGVAE